MKKRFKASSLRHSVEVTKKGLDKKHSSPFDLSKLGKGIKINTLKIGGTYKVRIVPWCATKGHPQVLRNKLIKGDATYLLPYAHHWGVGPDKESVVCRKTFGDKECPVCKKQNEIYKMYKERGDEKKREATAMKAKWKNLYWFYDVKHPEEPPQIYDLSSYIFEKELQESLSEWGNVDPEAVVKHVAYGIESICCGMYPDDAYSEEGDSKETRKKKEKKRVDFAKILKIVVEENKDLAKVPKVKLTLCNSKAEYIEHEDEMIEKTFPLENLLINTPSKDLAELVSDAKADDEDDDDEELDINDDDDDEVVGSNKEEEDDDDESESDDDAIDDEDEDEEKETAFECAAGIEFGTKLPTMEPCLVCSRKTECRAAYKANKKKNR